MTGRVPILTYHSLDATGSVISTSAPVFRLQMRRLHERGYRAVPLGDVLEAWERGTSLPGKLVALTFDDGFRSFLEHAAPVLKELGFGATLFAVAGHVGGRNDWPSQPPGLPLLPLLSWAELRRLADEGFEIGSHGLSHVPLHLLSGKQVTEEIVGSKRRLEDGLGRPVTAFAYPYGRANAAARGAAAAHYRGACSVRLGLASERDDRHWLRRVDMYYFRSPAVLRLFGTPPGAGYLHLRGLARDGRAMVRRMARRE